MESLVKQRTGNRSTRLDNTLRAPNCRSDNGAVEVPRIGYSELPMSATPAAQAAKLRQSEQGPDGQLDVLRLVRARGWHIERRRLSAANGGLQACLQPSKAHEFSISVDDDPSPMEEWEAIANPNRGDLRSALRNFRVAHELGHSFFYRQGLPPSRDDRPSDHEEDYCDRFAAALLVPPNSAVKAYTKGPEAVLRLARRQGTLARVVLASASQCDSVRAIAGWVHQDGHRLRVKVAFRFGLSDPPALWAAEPELLAAVQNNVEMSPLDKSRERPFLAFPRSAPAESVAA